MSPGGEEEKRCLGDAWGRLGQVSRVSRLLDERVVEDILGRPLERPLYR